MILNPERLGRDLPELPKGNLAPDEIGELVSASIGGSIPHDCLRLTGMNPDLGLTAFDFRHHYQADLGFAQLVGGYAGDDPCEPANLARLPTPVGITVEPAKNGRPATRAQEILSGHGLGSELRLLLRDSTGVWGMLALLREVGRAPFGRADAERAAALTKPLLGTLRSYVTAAPVRVTTPNPPPGVLMVGADHRVRALTQEARDWLERLRQPRPDQLAGTLTTQVALAARRAAAEGRSTSALVGVPTSYVGQWLAVHAQPVLGDDSGDVAVIVQAAGGELLLSMVAPWYGITAREQVVAKYVYEGLAPKQIARRLNLSVYTVNDYLKALFRKTGTHGRDEFVAVVSA
ncbi:helix-turn-helix transcriptional regulator [Amycolatopsis nigrescens]|uniref:helix-turn-helix transcriptional regulator n=1 Tax=Amycolatopsis nigrescens TaxID=381445 RepID=UPI0003706A76|nr:helix-turn-helix transcriptional regulator [Amycolatopsis nigrescens]